MLHDRDFNFIGWSTDDAARAEMDGGTVFEDGGLKLAIGREGDRFSDDHAAAAYVKELAQQGDLPALPALDAIRIRNAELAAGSLTVPIRA